MSNHLAVHTDAATGNFFAGTFDDEAAADDRRIPYERVLGHRCALIPHPAVPGKFAFRLAEPMPGLPDRRAELANLETARRRGDEARAAEQARSDAAWQAECVHEEEEKTRDRQAKDGLRTLPALVKTLTSVLAQQQRPASTPAPTKPLKPAQKLALTKLPADLLTRELPAPQYAWAPLLPMEGCSLLIGEGGLGKSFLLLELLLSIAGGLDEFLGHPIIVERDFLDNETKGGRAIYIAGEDGRDVLQQRAQTILRSDRFTPEQREQALKNFEFLDTRESDLRLVLSSRDATTITEWTAKLRDQIGAAVIVALDPLSRLSDGDENANPVMTRLVQAAEMIRAGTRGSVVLVHHVSKMAKRGRVVDSSAARGGSALKDAARSMILLTACDKTDLPNEDTDAIERCDFVRLAHVKANGARRAAPIYLQRQPDGTLVKFDRKEIVTDPLGDFVAWFRDPAPGGNNSVPITRNDARQNARTDIWPRGVSRSRAEVLFDGWLEDGKLEFTGEQRHGGQLYRPTAETLAAYEWHPSDVPA